jgi:hypothetical protein
MFPIDELVKELIDYNFLWGEATFSRKVPRSSNQVFVIEAERRSGLTHKILKIEVSYICLLINVEFQSFRYFKQFYAMQTFGVS